MRKCRAEAVERRVLWAWRRCVCIRACVCVCVCVSGVVCVCVCLWCRVYCVRTKPFYGFLQPLRYSVSLGQAGCGCEHYGAAILCPALGLGCTCAAYA